MAENDVKTFPSTRDLPQRSGLHLFVLYLEKLKGKVVAIYEVAGGPR
jgi:hypothetical protein